MSDWGAWAKIGMVVGGYALFGPLGGLAGAYLGSMIFPTEYDTEMPTVHDMPIQSSACGIPIPIVFGTVRVAGNIVWMGDLDAYQIKHSVGGGKGGGEQAPTYETRYRRSFLIAICEGPADIIRAWRDKTIMPLSDFTTFDGDNNAGISTLIGEAYAEYSNLCLAYFEDYELGNSSRMPNFIFEIGNGEKVTQNSLYVGTDEALAGNDVFEIDYDWDKSQELVRGDVTYGVHDIKIQPSTGRIIVSGVATYIYDKNWTLEGTVAATGTILIDPDDDDYMYIGNAGGVFKYKISTRVLEWQNITYGAVGKCISSATNKLYICGGATVGIHEINRNNGAWVRNLGTAHGHRIAYYDDHLYTTGARQGGKSVWRYNETSGALISDYDTGGITNRVIVWGNRIFVCGERSSNLTIWKFSATLVLQASYDDGNSVYWLNDMEVDTYRNQLVVTSKGDAVDEDANTANIRWFNSSLVLQDNALIYDSSSTCVVTAVTNFTSLVEREVVDFYGAGVNANQANYGTRRSAQTFTATKSYGYGLASVKLRLWRSGSPGTVTVRIWNTYWDNARLAYMPLAPMPGCFGTINGNNLVTAPIGNIGPYVEILISLANLTIGEHYAIVIQCQGADVFNLVSIGFDSTGTYASGKKCESTDNGATWTLQGGYDIIFQTLKDITLDLNFAEMIKALLINERYGNYDESDLITADFNSIISYCDANNLKGSLAISNQKPLPDWIAYICSHFQGYFYEIGGKIGLNCYKSEASVLSIVQDDLIRDDDAPPVHTTKRQYSSTFNRLEAMWTDRENTYKTAVVAAFDRIDQRESGQARTKTLNLKAITNAELASKMTWRIFIDQIYRFSQYAFKLGYKSMLLEIGDVIDVTDGHKLVAKKMRVMSINEEKDGRRALISAVEDISDLYPIINYAIQQSEAAPAADIVLTDGTAAFRENWNDNRLYLSITPSGTQCNGFYIFKSYDDASYNLSGKVAIENVTGGEANSTGTIQSGLPAHTSVVHRPLEAFDVSIGTITDLDTAISDDNFFNNRKLAKIGDEIIAYKICVESSVEGTWRVSNLIRGLFGTRSVAHVSGEVFSTLDIDFFYSLQESDIGKTLYFKVISFYATKIQLLSEVSSQSYQVKGLWKKPAVASLLRLSSDENDGGKTEYEGSSFTLYWNLPGQKGTGFNQSGFDLNDSYPEWRYGDSESELVGGNGVPYGNYLADDLLQGIDLVFEETDGTFISQRSVASTAQSEVISKADDLGGNASAVIKVYPRRAYRSDKAEPLTVTGV